jgi:HAD superfamily hydrolase (TIGR01509 family)
MSQLKAVIFGAIGTIVETSDIQRQAFNDAFAAVGLDWNWTPQTYRDLLKINGGQNRIRAYRDADPNRSGLTDATIANIHAIKTEHYVAMLENAPLNPRPGVVETIELCLRQHLQVALCTSTSIENVEGIATAVSDVLPFDRFATIVTIEQIEHTKPAPDAYLYCLKQLGLNADRVIAIEDTPVSLAAAKAAGIVAIATPGAMTSDQDFGAADLVLPDLMGITIDRLSRLLDRQPMIDIGCDRAAAVILQES